MNENISPCFDASSYSALSNTPVVDIGYENNQTVIFIVAEPELRVTQQTLMTITAVDARANNQKDWSRVNFTIEINWDADIKKTMTILQNVADQMYKEPYWQEKMLTSAQILGIDKINHEGIMIRLRIEPKPLQQWDVGREYRWRVKEVFDLAGIRIGIPQTEIIHRREENHNPPNF